MTAADWTPVIQAIIAAVAAIFTGLVGIYLPRAIALFERRTGVAVTEQQREAVLSAVTTAVGLVQSRLDTGKLHRDEITPEHPAIVAAAHATAERVPDAAAAQLASPEVLANMIAARVDTAQCVSSQAIANLIAARSAPR